MTFPKQYPFLNKNEISLGEYSLLPIRYTDRLDIMKWRNEQIYHLRQAEPLTEEKQNEYFQNVVATIFEETQPAQILFSYLKGERCVGYGGLVHINWVDKNAEISFIMDTSLEEKEFGLHWGNYLQMLEKVAFKDLDLHKIYTYAFDLRPQLFKAIEKVGFKKEAVLKEHMFYENKYVDVIYHSKINQIMNEQAEITLRRATELDCKTIFDWSNDPLTRLSSFYSDEISWEGHQEWFRNKLNSTEDLLLIAELRNEKIGLVRFNILEKDSVIGIVLDKNFRGKGLAKKILKKGTEFFFAENTKEIKAFVKPENKASINIFTTVGFRFVENTSINNIDCNMYSLKHDEEG